MAHKHIRFINACEKYLREENDVETTEGFLNSIKNYKGLPYTNTPTTDQLAQLLTRDKRFKQVDVASIPHHKGKYDVILWGLVDA